MPFYAALSVPRKPGDGARKTAYNRYFVLSAAMGFDQRRERVSAPRKGWTVYMVRCANGALYTGITNRLEERVAAHNSGAGAKYTASFGPVRLVWRRRASGRSSAARLEAGIKKLRRGEKEKLIGCRGRLPAKISG